MDVVKKLGLLLLISFVVVYFHDAFRMFLIILEGVPHLILESMGDWLGGGGFMEACALAFALFVTTSLYAGILLGGYWLVNRRMMLHANMLVFVVWFLILVVMTIGPKALAL